MKTTISETQPNAEAQAKIISIFGGLQLKVNHEDGSVETIRIRQLRMKEYQAAVTRLADEMTLTAFCCSLDSTPQVPCSVEWIMTLHPKSYEEIQAKVREVNKDGFFPYAARKRDEETKLNEQWIRLAAELPPDVLANLTKQGLSLSQMSSPRPR